jgi:hypothetical protein
MPRTLMRAAASAVALSFLAYAPLQAQRLGIIAGGTFSQLRGLDNVKAKNRTGTVVGATLTVPVGERMSLQPELLFINKGGALDYGAGAVDEVRLDYLEIPVLLRVEGASGGALNPHLYAGPSIGFNVGCNIASSGGGVPDVSSDCTRDNFKPKSVDWGAIVGAGVDLSLGGLGVTGGARYGVGLANIADDTNAALEQRVRNGTLTVYVGILFGRR